MEAVGLLDLQKGLSSFSTATEAGGIKMGVKMGSYHSDAAYCQILSFSLIPLVSDKSKLPKWGCHFGEN